MTHRTRRFERDDRPIYVLWKFDPRDGRIYITHNEDRHPAEHVTHHSWATHVTHRDHVRGYAYSITGGWRITDHEHEEVKNPDAINALLAALARRYPLG